MREQGKKTVAGKAGRVALLASLAVATAALTIPAGAREKAASAPPVSVKFDRSFTPAGADPRLAATFAKRGQLPNFSFTPAASKKRGAPVRVVVRGGSDAPAVTGNRTAEAVSRSNAVSTMNPSNYNLGVAVGWKRIGVSGDVQKREANDPRIANRESAVVGVSYNLKRFTGRLSVAADRDVSTVAPAIRPTDSYALDVGGEVKITRNLAVTGGVRYRIDQERIDTNLAEDRRQDSQAVYIGTAFKF
ncbi:hypothetical protein [Sphingomicrobium lutaoense]|uniref:Porin n=1 Tax=Sphingomicrobium lutaoense TaxID=515949 RepID=A0A839Z4K0_9SPHN|nr:hypothetical protein [Sphingomicrobium lutaoense]MBB3764783.1 hypothetical protein [Sphingomicrobium lutaoense]